MKETVYNIIYYILKIEEIQRLVEENSINNILL